MSKTILIVTVILFITACGKDGAPGKPGLNGQPGSAGSGCTVATVSPNVNVPAGGALITCGSTTTLLFNAAPNSEAAAYNIIGTIDPCGQSGNYDEIFLRTAAGRLVALYSENNRGDYSRLSFLSDNIPYITTDDQECHFSISTSGLIRTINWTSPNTGSLSWTIYY